MRAKAIAVSALTGALYALMSFFSLPIGAGVQLRISEALCVLPAFTPYAIPGLFVGCMLANILLGCAPYDVLFGSLATLIAAIMTRFMAQKGYNRWLLPLPAVMVNALVVGGILVLVYEVPLGYWMNAAYVAIGQVLSCYGLGMPLLFALEKRGERLFSGNHKQN